MEFLQDSQWQADAGIMSKIGDMFDRLSNDISSNDKQIRHDIILKGLSTVMSVPAFDQKLQNSDIAIAYLKITNYLCSMKLMEHSSSAYSEIFAPIILSIYKLHGENQSIVKLFLNHQILSRIDDENSAEYLIDNGLFDVFATELKRQKYDSSLIAVIMKDIGKLCFDSPTRRILFGHTENAVKNLAEVYLQSRGTYVFIDRRDAIKAICRNSPSNTAKFREFLGDKHFV